MMDEETAALRQLEDLLKRTAVGLKGPEPAMTMWGWEDLPDIATRYRAALLYIIRNAATMTKAQITDYARTAVWKNQ